MEVNFFDLKQQYQTLKDEVQGEIQEVLESGHFALGKKVDSFEKGFAAHVGRAHAVAVNSGTSALWLALLACGVKKGDGVLTTPNTFIATAEAISFVGATPFFVDVEQSCYNLDPLKLKEFVEKSCTFNQQRLVDSSTNQPITCIVPVHLYGHPCDIAPILEIARKYNLKVVEDCAQAHGAEYEFSNSSLSQFRGWVRVGRTGDVGCFSFYPTKNLGAYGEGGAIVTDDEGIANSVRMLRDHGQPSKNFHQLKGFNCRMSALQGAILGVKLRHLDDWNSRRRKIANLYNQLLSDTVITPREADHSRHVYHLYVVRTPSRDQLQKYLKSKGIHTAIHYPTPIHLQEAYRELGYGLGSFPVAEKHSEEVISLPIYPELREEEVEYVTEQIRSFFRNSGRK